MTKSSEGKLTSLAPQFLVDDLDRAIGFYRDVLGFVFGEPWGGFYAIGRRDGFELHLKDAPKTQADRDHRYRGEHLDAYCGVDGIDAFYQDCLAKGQILSSRWHRRPGVRRISTCAILRVTF